MHVVRRCHMVRPPRSHSRTATNDLKPEDVNFIGIECDVSSEISVQKAFAEVMNTYGRVDSVVASAGTFNPQSTRSPN